MNIRTWIKRLIAAQRDRKLRGCVNEISSRISLREKDGRLYIVCLGTAVGVMNGTSTCNDCVRAIQSTKRVAREYALGLEKDKQ